MRKEVVVAYFKYHLKEHHKETVKKASLETRLEAGVSRLQSNSRPIDHKVWFKEIK